MRTSIYSEPTRRTVTWDQTTDQLLAELARRRRQSLGAVIGDLVEKEAKRRRLVPVGSEPAEVA